MLVEDEIDKKIDVFVFVILVHICLSTIRDEFVDLGLSENIHLDCERLKQRLF